MLRRSFLRKYCQLFLLIPLARVISACSPRLRPGAAAAMQPDEFQRTLLSEVQSHLFPDSKNCPGAKTMQSTEYLLTSLQRADANSDDMPRLLAGLDEVEQFSNSLFRRQFVELKSSEREKVLRAFEQTDAGYRWLHQVLSNTVEGLLADPLYGSNLDQAGWRWLEHNPGFPRPQAGKLYFEI